MRRGSLVGAYMMRMTECAGIGSQQPSGSTRQPVNLRQPGAQPPIHGAHRGATDELTG